MNPLLLSYFLINLISNIQYNASFTTTTILSPCHPTKHATVERTGEGVVCWLISPLKGDKQSSWVPEEPEKGNEGDPLDVTLHSALF